MRRLLSSGQFTLLLFFVTVILGGSLLLAFPGAWAGEGRLSYLDALFTAASAVCVTGLITVDTAQYSLFGKLVIMILIQVGGLGIMSFATLYLTNPLRRISLMQARIIQDYYVDDVEHKDRKIVRNILAFTLVSEAAGALVLYVRFAAMAHDGRVFADGVALTAVFHSVSAFCNAGFSLFSDSLESFSTQTTVLVVVITLIVVGGLGFVVIQELLNRLLGKSRSISLHSRIVLWMTVVLIAGAAVVYYLLENSRALAGMRGAYGPLNAVFQSVTTRTAGFNVISQRAMAPASRVFTLFMMFTGGAPGSIAGGVKVTTMFLVLVAVLRGTEPDGALNVRRRRIVPETIARAQLFVLRALGLLFASVLALCVSELAVAGSQWTFVDVVFESFSAFGTVGLSLGITPQLTAAGKLIIIFTMFAGRVGLMTIAIARPLPVQADRIEYASEKILIG